MASKYVLDTHTLVWYLEGSPRLSTRAKAIVDDSSNQLVVPLIVLAEAAFLVERGRIAISSVPNLLSDVQAATEKLQHPTSAKFSNYQQIPPYTSKPKTN